MQIAKGESTIVSMIVKRTPASEAPLFQRPKWVWMVKRIGPYLFLAPALLFLAIFLLYPVATMLIFSFSEVNIGSLLSGVTPFVGLKNYQTVLSDPLFLSTLKISLLFTAGSLVFQFSLGFLLALLFNERFPGASVMRGLVMVAWMLPIVVSGTIFRWMLQADAGVINHLLRSIGLIDDPIQWLSNPSVALWSVIIANIWVGIPFNMSLLLAGLQGISGSLYEAARVDGANALNRFRYVTLPLMRSTSLTVLVLGFIYTLNVFDLIFIMTSGGPANATEPMSMYAYRVAFSQFDLGQGSAVATLMFLLLLAGSVLYLYLIRREEAA